ncbi:MAG: hypothetical protein M3Y56_10455, partial [Armatimonadota bacterium]|nr:hypothetical protein [Armatimonadota bacterium]
MRILPRLPFWIAATLAAALCSVTVHAQTAPLPTTGPEVTSTTVTTNLNDLLAGVHEIAAPGLPGSIAVFGPNAWPVVVGGAGKDARESVVAAALAGKGRVVAFGHTSYLDRDALQKADTGRLMLNAIRWVGGKAQPEVALSGQPDLIGWLGTQGIHATAHGPQ